ncbi:MAG TPA: hypothetical protein VKY51_03145 [Fredinandcohnia sp.]|nr:hypothetical protein [Fredinandcohnia sp.]
MWRALPLLVLLAWPLPAGAEAAAQDEDEEEDGEIGWGGETGVTGGPLDLSHLGKRPSPPPKAEPQFERGSWTWGIRETPLHLVPAGVGYGSYEPEVQAFLSPPWPGPAMVDAWDLASAYSFPRLAPAVGAELFTTVGERQTDDRTLFTEAVRLNFYFLELRTTAVGSVGGERLDRTDLDLDFRIPVRLGRTHRLAFLPGVTFPIDGRSATDDNTAIRFQALYGIGGAGLGFQGRVGFTEGSRTRGLLQVDERVRDPAFLYGALLAWRFVPGVQIHLEGSGEIGLDAGPDPLTLLAGPVFFPFGDPRLSLGALGIVETTAQDLSFRRPIWGGIVQIGLDFL